MTSWHRAWSFADDDRTAIAAMEPKLAELELQLDLTADQNAQEELLANEIGARQHSLKTWTTRIDELRQGIEMLEHRGAEYMPKLQLNTPIKSSPSTPSPSSPIHVQLTEEKARRQTAEETAQEKINELKSVTAELRGTRALIQQLSPERKPLQAAARNCNPARVSHHDTKRQGPKAKNVQRCG